MTIEIKDGIYFAAIWHVEDRPRGNWMGAVYRTPDGTWHLKYRHRYYADDKLDETSADTKNWYHFTAECGGDHATEVRMIKTVDRLVAALTHAGYGSMPPIKVEVHSDRADDVLAAFETVLAPLNLASINAWHTPELPLSVRRVPRGQT